MKSNHLNRRNFIKLSGAGLLLGNPAMFHAQTTKPGTNVKDVLNIPRTKHSLPGLAPGAVVEVFDQRSYKEGTANTTIVNHMVRTGIQELTGSDLSASFNLLFSTDDIIGIKVNPVGAKLISTRLEVVDAVIAWLNENGIKNEQIVIWDRFDYMLHDAGFTTERFPGCRIEGLQTMDESAASGESDDDSKWLGKDGRHVSIDKFDINVYYWAEADAPQDKPYLNQHVVNTHYSYFGKLLTETLTKIINIPVFKNTGNGISMATKNMGYGAVCNTGRLHRPLFFDVCTEVLAFPAIRDKLVLNITDGLRGQYDGGPGAAAKFVYDLHTLYFATDPFALDMVCHNQIVQKRREMGVDLNEHPKYTQYLHYAQELKLGITDPAKIKLKRIESVG
jgi:hypothetical protein